MVIYKGAPQTRKQLVAMHMQKGKFNIVITTYDYIMKDQAVLRKYAWEYIVIDEASLTLTLTPALSMRGSAT